MEEDNKKSFILEFIYLFLIFGLLYLAGKFILSYLLPFVFAGIIGTYSRKLSLKFFKKCKLSLKFCSVLVAALLQVVLFVVLFASIYFLFDTIKDLFSNLPVLFDNLNEFIGKTEKSFNDFFKDISPQITDNLSGVLKDSIVKIETKIITYISNFVTAFLKNTPALFFALIVTFVASCYIAKDYDILRKFISELLGKKFNEKIIKIKNIFTQNVFKFVKGYMLLMLLTFVELTVAFLILKIKFAPIIALIISVVDLLPVLGTGTILIPWSVFEFITNNSSFGISIIIVYILITVIRNFTEPKIIGKQIGINPLFTLIAMFIGLRLFGFLGLILCPLSLIVIIKYYKDEIDFSKEV